LPLPTSREIEEAAAVREKDGPAMRVLLAGFVELRHGTGLAPGVRDAEERAGWAGGKEDDSPAVPGPAPSRRKRRREKSPGRAPGSLDLLQRPLREESDEAAVPRPEGGVGVFRAGKRPGFERIERTNPQEAPAVGARRDERQAASVPRKGDHPRDERGLLRGQD